MCGGVVVVNQILGLWRDTWIVWCVFLALSVAMGAVLGWFFYLLVVCLPVPFLYFAFNRYDSLGREKADL